MSKQMNRRKFIKTGTAIGIGAALGHALIPKITEAADTIDIAVVKGADYYKAAVKAVEMLGGMSKFVKQGSKVILLPNPQSNNPGTFTKPQIVRAAIHMCKASGASEIACLGWLSMRYWQNTGIKKVLDEEGAQLIIADENNEELFMPVPVPKGVILKEAWIMKEFYKYDVFINMNITKEHSGNNFSGALKNLMGINSPASDQTFHKRSMFGREDIGHLDQCIADINTIIHPNLCIADSTEFIITNGPNGPGKLRKLQKVVACTNPVSIDAFCSTFFGYNPRDILAIRKSHEHGLGEIELSKLRINEIEI